METNETESNFLPIVVVITGLLIVAGAVVWNGLRPAGSPQEDNGAAQKVDIKNVKTDGDAFIGAVDAPVTIASWSDFQCPRCKQFELDTLPQIITEYVDTGKVKLVFMDFAFLGNDSITAALYGRSIWKLYPSQYLAWRTAMYIAQDEEGDKGFGNAESIDTLNATIAGFDAVKIAADVKENTNIYRAAIDADRVEVKKAHITGTPSFVIGTQLIQGAHPYPTFKDAIDPLLK